MKKYSFKKLVLYCRYDKTSECLAVRILNIKNIPRNNKEASFYSSRSLTTSYRAFAKV